MGLNHSEYIKIKDRELTKVKESKKKDESIDFDNVIESLKTQINYHNTMLIKAQGALEVMVELKEKTEK